MAEIDPDECASMPLEHARAVIREADFARALALRKGSLDPATLKKYEDWKATNDAEGIGSIWPDRREGKPDSEGGGITPATTLGQLKSDRCYR
jgi:hypothetical protein